MKLSSHKTLTRIDNNRTQSKIKEGNLKCSKCDKGWNNIKFVVTNHNSEAYKVYHIPCAITLHFLTKEVFLKFKKDQKKSRF